MIMGFWQRLWGRPTQDDFASMVGRALRAAGLSSLNYDREGFALRGGDSATYLHNIYHAYLDCPRKSRAALLARFVRATAGMQHSNKAGYTRQQIEQQLLPRVRTRAFYEGIGEQLLMDGHRSRERLSEFRALSEHLAVGLVMDFPDHVEEGPFSLYLECGFSLDEAYELAQRNLVRLSEAPLTSIAPGLYVSPWRDNHDASRLLLSERIAALPLRGLPVVMAAHRDVLFVSGTREREGLLQMAIHTAELIDEPRSISAIPLCLIDDSWAPFVPEPHEEAHRPFTLLRLRQLSAEYANQRAQLRHRFERLGDDVFVAGYTAMQSEQHEQESPFSYCVWSRGVPSLLPRTDRVALVDPARDREPVLCDWQRLSEVMGDALAAEPLYPPRYRTSGFPTAEQLDALA